MSRQLVLASNNSGKVKEFQTLLQPYSLQVTPQSELGVVAIAETAVTFVENALLKARHAARVTGLPALGDDSGLCVAALRGAPGLYSSRYAGEQAEAVANWQKLLAELIDVPSGQRQAYFYCVTVYLRYAEDPLPIISEGICYGSILDEARGEQGFGYDPIFYVPEYGCSAAELPSQIKNQISHRGQALRGLVTKLKQAGVLAG